MRLRELRRRCRETLVLAGAARPEYSADLIISRRLGIGRAELLYKDDEIPAQSCEGIFAAAARRAQGVPLAYVLHEAEFYGYRFKVGRGVLIPRPETELLVEAALEYFPRGRSARFADWCTGSGCIALSLLLENGALTGVGIDKSPQALRWAAINRKFHHLEDRLALLRNAEPSEAAIDGESLDFIISNPPYIPEGEMAGLMPEVRDYEPHMALNGGAGGLALYKKFFRSFPGFLKPGGLLLLETAGSSQICALEGLVSSEFVLMNKILDYNGIIRHIIWRKR
ncbi:peptide chain release factor N(5)-glutamine methyltransferase [Cloacibacillus evryensis]|uniref:peptide chain release factor N(5)-glutamine methyltransferase n=1 Tax=Cloacibacillus evryensis TaxID=508460 RepID=UPI003AB70C6E